MLTYASFGLEALTTLTGGRRLMISGRAEPAFDRIARETSSSYILGFDAERGDRDGKPHTVTVTTSRRGVEVRARRLFAFVDNAVAAPPVAAPSPTSGENPPPEAVTTGSRVTPATPAASGVSAGADPRRDGVQLPDSTAQVKAGRQAPPGAVTLEQVPQRMGEYVEAYGDRTALIVATEKYTQRVSTEDGSNFPPRQMLAEFAIVKVAGPLGWIGFRDIVEVNGEKLTDRRDRLLNLLSAANGDASEARRISNESARFNIGPISRNFNVPTATLFFFHPSNLARFSFKAKGTKKIHGVDAWVLEFKETRHPSMVMTRAGKDVPCEGSLWVSPTDGTIVRTVVTFRGFADEKVLQGVREKGSQTAAPSSPTQSPAVPAVSQPSSSTQTPPQQTAPPSAGQPSGGGASGQKGSGSTGSPVSGAGREPRQDLGSGPTPQQLLSDTFPDSQAGEPGPH